MIKSYKWSYVSDPDEEVARYNPTYCSHTEAMATVAATGGNRIKFLGHAAIKPTCTIFPGVPIVWHNNVAHCQIIGQWRHDGGGGVTDYCAFGFYFPFAAWSILMCHDDAGAETHIASYSHITATLTEEDTVAEFATAGLAAGPLNRFEVDITRIPKGYYFDYALGVSIESAGTLQFKDVLLSYGRGNSFEGTVCPIILNWDSDSVFYPDWFSIASMPKGTGTGFWEDLTE